MSKCCVLHLSRLNVVYTISMESISINKCLFLNLSLGKCCVLHHLRVNSVDSIAYKTTSVCKCLVHALVTSRLDYGNAMLFGLSDRLLHRLERVQRSAARVVMQLRRDDRRSITAVLQHLHWLPVRKRIEYKLLMVVHTALYAGTPVYLALLLHRHSPRRTLRSGGGLLLDVPRVNLERYGRRAFACAGPTLWNSLPLELRVIQNTRQFGKLLKTFLFLN